MGEVVDGLSGFDGLSRFDGIGGLMSRKTDILSHFIQSLIKFYQGKIWIEFDKKFGRI